MKTVDGYSAIGWLCDHCSAQNYSDMVTVELADEDIQQQPELQNGTWVMAPEVVKCKDCKTKYKLNYGEDYER